MSDPPPLIAELSHPDPESVATLPDDTVLGSDSITPYPETDDEHERNLLQRVTHETVSFFDMPHRSVSNVTVVPSMYLTWHNISAYIVDKNSKSTSSCCDPELGIDGKVSKKDVLRDVFGYANPGEIMAIMGSSGAGKTSLLNVLTQGNMGELNVQGQVKVNGLTVDRNYMRKISAYVQQDDLFIGSLTVEEHLRFMAMLRMGKRYSTKEQLKRVRTVMRDLGLMGVANSIIGTRTRRGLSGGEKKRLAFASEILTSPPILFCDEPTSGLDAFLAFQVITVLRDLARRKGMTIVMTIHQPSSQVFEIFDRVYFMTEGRVAFCGTQAEAVSMWNGTFVLPVPLNFNPADHYIKTLAVTQRDTDKQKVEVNRLCDEFLQSEVGAAAWELARGREGEMDSPLERAHRKKREKQAKEGYKSSYWQQMRMLCWRQMKTTLREPMLLKVQIFHSIVVAVLTGIVYAGTPVGQSTVMTINGALFQCVSNMAFMFQFSVVHNFSSEVPVFLREHNNGLYRVSTYFLSKNLIELPSFIFLAALFCSILYWMSPLVNSFEAFCIYVLVSALVQSCAVSVGYAFSCAFEKLSVAMAIMPIFVVPMMAFAGFFINQDTLPVYFYPLKYLSWFNYGFEALAVNQWTRVDEIPGCYANSTVTTPSPCIFPTGTDVLSTLSFSPSNLWRDCLLLTLLVFGIRFIAFISLYIRAKRHK